MYFVLPNHIIYSRNQEKQILHCNTPLLHWSTFVISPPLSHLMKVSLSLSLYFFFSSNNREFFFTARWQSLFNYISRTITALKWSLGGCNYHERSYFSIRWHCCHILSMQEKPVRKLSYLKQNIIYHSADWTLRRTRGGLFFSTTGTTFSISCRRINKKINNQVI